MKLSAAVTRTMPHTETTTPMREFLIAAEEWAARLTFTPRSFVVLDIALILLFFCR